MRQILLKPYHFAKHFFKKRWKLLAILLVVALGVGGWLYSRNQAAQPTFTFIQPEIKDLTKTLEVSGIVDAKEKASLRFALGGKVTYLGAKEGDFVKKFQTLATIDQATLQKQLETSLNTYMKERLDWEQTLDDTADRALPESENRTVQQEQLDLNNQVLSVEVQDIAIKNTRLTAPFAGVLVSSPTTVSGITLLATDVFELINPETLIFKAAVDETDIAQVHIGDEAHIVLDAYPDEILNTAISQIGLKSQQSSSGTVFLVEVPIVSSTPFPHFRLGMNGDLRIKVDQRQQVLSIPLDATRQRDDKTFVDIKVTDAEVAEREIEIGMETDDEVEVLSGLTTADWIVLPE